MTILMRTLNLASLVFGFGIPFSANAQFPSIPDSNAIWFEETTLGPDPLFSSGFYLEPFDHDSLINDTLFNLLGSGFYPPQISPPFYCGGLFDDLFGRVYFRDFSSNWTYLLYDFSLDIGDSVNVCVSEGCGNISFPVKMFVLNVDTLIIHDEPFKRLQIVNAMGSGGMHYWIQRIGGTGGILSTLGSLTVSTETRLTCMSYNDTIWFQGSASNCIYTSIRPLPHGEIPVSFFHPSLTTNNVTLDITTANSQPIEVFTSDGRMVLRERVPGSVLDVSGLKPGVYVLRVVDRDGRVWQGRFMKE